jgi:tRNA U34 5-methylaminomethyl-2-thiouridine-forming methyltransferase MnmC
LASPRTISDFEVILTADGSPSLRIADDTGYVEKMHHSGGALSESLYIYGDALEEVLQRRWPLRVISVGLGLGYNEMIVAAKAIQNQIAADQAALFSFEIEPVLVTELAAWLNGQSCEFAPLYEKILKLLAEQTAIEPQAIFAWLKEAHLRETWQIRKSFPEDAQGVSRVSCIFYDAFSNKMSPELWHENILNNVIESMSAENCVLSTYACTGALKRALKHSGFARVDRPGFAGKRESTFAVRGIAER